jgi:hypothetical protein
MLNCERFSHQSRARVKWPSNENSSIITERNSNRLSTVGKSALRSPTNGEPYGRFRLGLAPNTFFF